MAGRCRALQGHEVRVAGGEHQIDIWCFRKLADSVGVHCRLHDLRHTHGLRAGGRGVDHRRWRAAGHADPGRHDAGHLRPLPAGPGPASRRVHGGRWSCRGRTRPGSSAAFSSRGTQPGARRGRGSPVGGQQFAVVVAESPKRRRVLGRGHPPQRMAENSVGGLVMQPLETRSAPVSRVPVPFRGCLGSMHGGSSHAQGPRASRTVHIGGGPGARPDPDRPPPGRTGATPSR
jgi:hypothetical protein